MLPTYDVLIVGAGPAGAGAAKLLAAQGARVLLLEKERFPRYKACGGAVDGMAIRELNMVGIDLRPICESAPTELRVTAGGHHLAVYRFEQPLGFMTMRSDLDAHIVQAAVAGGAEFHDGEPVKSMLDNGRDITITTSQGVYRGRVLIGADGAYSTIARVFELNRNSILYVLAAVELEVDEKTQAAWSSRVQVDISLLPLGYGWVFPKRSHLSLGFGVPRRSARRLPFRLEQFRQQVGLRGGQILQQRTHMLRFRHGQAPIASDRTLLVGDAAGLVDPNSGSGIGWALRSARLASAMVLSYLNGESGSLHSYTKLVDEELEPELSAARILRNSIILRFALTRGRATHDKELWKNIVQVVRGELQYRGWYARSRLARWLAWTRGIPL